MEGMLLIPHKKSQNGKDSKPVIHVSLTHRRVTNMPPYEPTFVATIKKQKDENFKNS